MSTPTPTPTPANVEPGKGTSELKVVVVMIAIALLEKTGCMPDGSKEVVEQQVNEVAQTILFVIVPSVYVVCRTLRKMFAKPAPTPTDIEVTK